MNDYWFKPKRFGYGATPIHWKGWAVSFAYAVVLLSLVWVIAAARNGALSTAGVVIWMLLVAVLTLVFMRFVRARTDGTWRWRWGNNGGGRSP